MWYDVALFVHILGAIGLFSAVSMVMVALVRMGQASTVGQIREWAAVAQLAGKSIPIIALVILAPALYMVIMAWGFTRAWVLAAIITYVVLAVLGAAVNGKTLERLAATAQAAGQGPVPAELRAQLTATRLWLAEGTQLMLLVGIVFLMTLKPNLLFSVVDLVSALLLGILLGVLLRPIAQHTQKYPSYEEQRA